MLKFGIDSFLENKNKKGKIGFVTNDAAKTSSGILSRKALLDAGFEIVKLFSPEHGINVQGADGAFIDNETDPITHLPIVSLYGENLKPSKLDLEKIDHLIFDIPDIGARFYTYLWTLTYVLEAAAENQIPLTVLDRPNPISGNLDLAEGPFLDEENCTSFIGRWNIPLRHSCTLGELALYFNQKIEADLNIVPCENWNRNVFFPDWKLDFVPTSPAIQHFESMLFYPGTGLLEAVNISEGRGGPSAFQTFGAPWLQGLETINSELKGAFLVPEIFTPTMGEYANVECFGYRFESQNLESLKPVFNMLTILKWAFDKFPSFFAWRNYPTRANPSGERHLDYLLGVKNSQETFSLSKEEFTQFWEKHLDAKPWKPILIY